MVDREQSLGRTQEIYPPQTPLNKLVDVLVGVGGGMIVGIGFPQATGMLVAGVGMESFRQGHEFVSRVREVADFVSPITGLIGTIIGFRYRHEIRHAIVTTLQP